MKFLKEVIWILSAILLVILNNAFLKNFDLFININLPAAIIIFFAAQNSYSRAILFSIIAGYLMDLKSIYFFGFHLISFFIVLFVVFFLNQKFLKGINYLNLFLKGIIAGVVHELFFFGIILTTIDAPRSSLVIKNLATFSLFQIIITVAVVMLFSFLYFTTQKRQ